MSIIANPVSLTPVITFIGIDAPEPQSVVLYTVGASDSERIESVYLSTQLGGSLEVEDILSLQLVDQSRVVLYEQPTPLLKPLHAENAQGFFTWSRAGNDNDQQAVAQQFTSQDTVLRMWANMRLPELVLQPLSYVNLLYYTESGNEGGGLSIVSGSVTVTKNGAGVSGTTAIDLQPFLLATVNS